MKKYGLLGKGIEYSLSPKLHKIIFDKLSIKAEYILLDKDHSKDSDDEYIEKILEKIRNKEIEGINVTIPYKEKIIKYLDIVDENAKIIGAVNTIVLEENNLKGYNTDYFGIVESLKEMNLKIKKRKIYILGTGGACRAVVKTILDLEGIPKIVSRETKYIEIFNQKFKTLNYEELNLLKKEYLLIDSTPVQLSKKIELKFENIFQMKYYLNKNKRFKKNYMDGLFMLVVQGIKSEEIWQNKKINSYKKIYTELLERIKKNEKSDS